MKLLIYALTKDIFGCILFTEKITVSIPWTLGPYTTAVYFLSVAEGNWKISSVSRDKLMSKILVDGGMSRLSKQDWPTFVLVRVRSLVINFFKRIICFYFYVYLYMCEICNLCANAHRRQKRVSNPKKLKLQEVVSHLIWVPGFQFWSFGRKGNSLTSETLLQSPINILM